jgi:hypothetical protein
LAQLNSLFQSIELGSQIDDYGAALKISLTTLQNLGDQQFGTFAKLNWKKLSKTWKQHAIEMTHKQFNWHNSSLTSPVATQLVAMPRASKFQPHNHSTAHNSSEHSLNLQHPITIGKTACTHRDTCASTLVNLYYNCKPSDCSIPISTLAIKEAKRLIADQANCF